jgi:hypothetical protein
VNNIMPLRFNRITSKDLSIDNTQSSFALSPPAALLNNFEDYTGGKDPYAETDKSLLTSPGPSTTSILRYRWVSTTLREVSARR